MVKRIIKETEIGKKMIVRSIGFVLKVIENCCSKTIEKSDNENYLTFEIQNFIKSLLLQL
ncbi:MAG: hypothetical protein ACTSQO_04670 [Candidatus Helarchaeota archaeon]